METTVKCNNKAERKKYIINEFFSFSGARGYGVQVQTIVDAEPCLDFEYRCIFVLRE